MNDGQTRTPRLTSNRFYDVLKFLALVLLPALSAFYYALSLVWEELPKTQEIMGTIAATETFLGVMLKLSSSAYHNSDAKYDGQVVVERDEGGITKANMVVPGDPHELLENKTELVFKVASSTPLPAKPTAP